MKHVELPFVIPTCNEEDPIGYTHSTQDELLEIVYMLSLLLGINGSLRLNNEHQTFLIKTR
jgi:hypothetical protein